VQRVAMYLKWACLFLTVSAVAYSQNATSGVTPSDCVQVRYIRGVWMNMQGTQVAYLVKSPNLSQNRNDYQLYVKDIRNSDNNAGRLVIAGTDISAVSWLDDGNRLALLMPVHGIKTLLLVKIDDGSQEVPLASSRNIEAYSIDGIGDTIAYSTANANPGKHALAIESDDELAYGYRVHYGEGVGAKEGYTTSSLYIERQQADGTWAAPEQTTVEDPFTHEKMRHLRGLEHLSLSPNGKRLALQYWTDSPLTEWADSPYVRSILKSGPLSRILVIQDFEKHTTSLGFKTVFPDSVPLWARDSRSFVMNAHSPVGSKWEQDDIRDHRTSPLDANLFWVDVESGNVEEVFRQVPSHHEGPLFWRADGDVIIEMPGNVVARLHRDRERWHEIERTTLPAKEGGQFNWLTSNGVRIVGIHEAVNVPGDLFIYGSDQNEIRIITDLNPQLRLVRLAPFKMVHWNTHEGLAIDGLLFMPPEYHPGSHYPLVIQTKGDQGWFTCDSGVNHDPSFAPQPIASTGIMYLVRTTADDFNFQDELAKAPKDYPGQLGLAAQQMDIWDSAVEALSDQGLIDPNKVGIIGFSATGFYVEFILSQSRTHYAAATVTDNAQYSLSEYWLLPTFADAEESMYGGPPYGRTLENWQKYSITFNLDRIHTPLLMEEMGYGVHDDILGALPRNLADRYEILKGLTRLAKPVEMYYYPNEDHAPDDPKARLASLQRNVDWYRFWLQGYEDQDPKKEDQYRRWRKLRDLETADFNATHNQ
jgi:dipeptidyl aminopeptidase/acylaminoacyl peptidase